MYGRPDTSYSNLVLQSSHSLLTSILLHAFTHCPGKHKSNSTTATPTSTGSPPTVVKEECDSNTGQQLAEEESVVEDSSMVG